LEELPWNVLVDVIADSVLDTLELVPFLFVTYLAMEALEHSTEGAVQGIVARAGHAGPVVGGLLGAIPQCGFSAMAATLFSGGVVTVGTLVAVILSTSDEMVPVFLAHQEPVGHLLSIMLLKVVVGIIVGLLLDAVLHAVRHVGTPKPHITTSASARTATARTRRERGTRLPSRPPVMRRTTITTMVMATGQSCALRPFIPCRSQGSFCS
jgi:hypothetical protein